MPKFTATVTEERVGYDVKKTLTVTAFANGKRILGWTVPNRALVQRLVAAIEAGAAFEAHDAETISVNGVPTTLPAGWTPLVMGRYMSADLKALGF